MKIPHLKKLFSSKYSDAAINIAALLLRLSLGIIMMMAHGLGKLQHFDEKASTFTDPFHLGKTISLSLVVFAEFFCSFLIVIGFMTRLASIPLIITMATALYAAHHLEIFESGERATLFLAGYLVLLLIGPGKFSIDRMISK